MRTALVIAFLGVLASSCASARVQKDNEALRKRNKDLQHDLGLCMQERKTLMQVLGERRRALEDPKLRDK